MKKPSINSIIGTLENIKKEQNHLICHFYSTRINYEIIVTDPDQIETVKNIKPKSLACVQFEKKETVLKSQNYPHLEYKTDQYIAQNIDPIDQDLKKIMVELSNKNPTRAIENPYIIYRTATMVQKHQTYN